MISITSPGPTELAAFARLPAWFREEVAAWSPGRIRFAPEREAAGWPDPEVRELELGSALFQDPAEYLAAHAPYKPYTDGRITVK